MTTTDANTTTTPTYTAWTTCPACGGDAGVETCPACHGVGSVREFGPRDEAGPAVPARISARKQTAGNNEFLADVKHHFNKPLFAMATTLVNGPNGPAAGEAEMRAYLLKNVCRTLDGLSDRRG